MRFLYKSACDTRADNSNLLGDGPGGDDDGSDGVGGCDGGAGGNGDDGVGFVGSGDYVGGGAGGCDDDKKIGK